MGTNNHTYTLDSGSIVLVAHRVGQKDSTSAVATTQACAFVAVVVCSVERALTRSIHRSVLWGDYGQICMCISGVGYDRIHNMSKERNILGVYIIHTSEPQQYT